MFIPPVGRYSAFVFDNVFYVIIINRKQNVFGFLGVCAKNFGNIFVIDSLTEIILFKITRRVAGEKNGSLISSQFNVRTSVFHLYRL